jgi:hypothetical protein
MLTTLVVGIAIGAMSVFFLQATSGSDMPVSVSEPVLAKNVDASAGELQLLREENAQLKLQLSQSAPVVQVTNNSKAGAQPAAATTPNCDAQLAGLMNFYNEKDRTLADLNSIKDPAQYDAKLSAEFLAEPRDEKWSHVTEAKIQHELSSRDEMRDFVLSNVQCRAATCELKIPAADMDAKNKIMTSLSSPGALAGMGFGNQYSLKTALQSKAGEMIVYISKK